MIASFHWGSEYRDDFTGEQRTIGRAAIKAGADIVVGTHPHIVQGIGPIRTATSSIRWAIWCSAATSILTTATHIWRA